LTGKEVVAMRTALVVHASRHGSTAGIADRIGEVLHGKGIQTAVASASSRPDPTGFDAVIIGSGIYLGRWLEDAIGFVERNRVTLVTKPVWLFSSGPLKGANMSKPGSDPLVDALGPEDGPGSGGHKQLTALATAVNARENHVFYGAYDPADPPQTVPERLLRIMPFSKGILPTGDYREWDVIEAWAGGIAAELLERVPAATLA
jgi:menaquinone-dependent protoporphyrinogen oxidase